MGRLRTNRVERESGRWEVYGEERAQRYDV